MLKKNYIFGLVIKLAIFITLFCSNGASAKNKSNLEEEFNKSREAYNQQQKIYKKALERYELQIKHNKPLTPSKEQQEEYNSLLEMYKQQQEDYYKLSELDRQFREKTAKRQTPLQLAFIGIGLISAFPAAAFLFIGTALFYVFKKPLGKKLAKSGALLGILCGLSFLLARKDYILVSIILTAVSIYFFYKKKKQIKKI